MGEGGEKQKARVREKQKKMRWGREREELIQNFTEGFSLLSGLWREL